MTGYCLVMKGDIGYGQYDRRKSKVLQKIFRQNVLGLKSYQSMTNTKVKSKLCQGSFNTVKVKTNIF